MRSRARAEGRFNLGIGVLTCIREDLLERIGERLRFRLIVMCWRFHAQLAFQPIDPAEALGQELPKDFGVAE